MQEYCVTEFQPIYYVAESFKDAKEKLRYSSHSREDLTLVCCKYSGSHCHNGSGADSHVLRGIRKICAMLKDNKYFISLESWAKMSSNKNIPYA